MRIFVAFVFFLPLAACTDERTLIVETAPSGAIVYDRASGATSYTPALLSYTLPENIRAADGCFLLAPLEVRWESGAAVTDSAPRFCGSDQWVLRYQRPDVPGIDVDLRVAASQAARAVETTGPAVSPALAEGANSFGQALGAAIAGAPASPSVTCRSEREPGYGGTYRTTCR